MHAPQSIACPYIFIFENIKKMYWGEIMTLFDLPNVVVRDSFRLIIKYTDGCEFC